MLTNLKQEWRAFRASKPGHRFQERFDRHQRTRKSQSFMRRLLKPFIAIILLAIGVVLTFIPGPGIVFYFAGAGLLAEESRLLARGLDKSELKLRQAYRWSQRWWQQAALWAKVAVVFAAACLASAACYAFYRLFFGK
jgi:hypothetical protein